VTTTRVKKRAREGDINGKERCGNDSEGDNKGGKGNVGRGYEDNGNDGRSFTAVLSRQPSSSHRPSSATNRHRHQMKVPHTTLFARLPPQIVTNNALPLPHTVITSPLLSSLDSHRHPPLHSCVILAHPPPLDRCKLVVIFVVVVVVGIIIAGAVMEEGLLFEERQQRPATKCRMHPFLQCCHECAALLGEDRKQIARERRHADG
jgi:hypothetical protein